MSLRLMRYAGRPQAKYVETTTAWFPGGDLQDFLAPYPGELDRAVFRVETDEETGQVMILVDDRTPREVRKTAGSDRVLRAARQFVEAQKQRPYGLSPSPTCWPIFGACFAWEDGTPLPDWTRTIEKAPGFMAP